MKNTHLPRPEKPQAIPSSEMPVRSKLRESARSIPVQDRFDVIVCGAGPAGIAAAISAARLGAATCLVEGQGCLGGIWTSGLLSVIHGAVNTSRILQEIRERLRETGGMDGARDLYDAEAMKFLLEEMCTEAGVEIRLHTRVCAADVEGRQLRHVILEANEGRFALAAEAFVDTTGNGDLAALAGCGFDLGRDEDGKTQPMSLMGLLSGVPVEVRSRDGSGHGSASCIPKREFLKRLQAAGVDPSYIQPSLFPLPNSLCALMVDHQYSCSGLDARQLTLATVQARRELHRAVAAMKSFSPAWRDLRLVGTAAHIGVREGRRIHGIYRVTGSDISHSIRHQDAVAHVTFGIDIHSVSKGEGGGYDNGQISFKPYDIPLRALTARDLDNLYMAGRCLSGDFYAHASYRVTGVAVPTGEAAGAAAARLSAEYSVSNRRAQ